MLLARQWAGRVRQAAVRISADDRDVAAGAERKAHLAAAFLAVGELAACS